MLERAKLRREKLNSHKYKSQAGITNRPVIMPLRENNNIDNGVPSMTEKKSHAPSNLSSLGKSKLEQLGDLYSENSALTSPIHRAEEKILAEAAKNSSQPKCRLGR